MRVATKKCKWGEKTPVELTIAKGYQLDGFVEAEKLLKNERSVKVDVESIFLKIDKYGFR